MHTTVRVNSYNANRRRILLIYGLIHNEIFSKGDDRPQQPLTVVGAASAVKGMNRRRCQRSEQLP
jgi:hypothetical protein